MIITVIAPTNVEIVVPLKVVLMYLWAVVGWEILCSICQENKCILWSGKYGKYSVTVHSYHA
jgi:hypothetical protein